jgi:hypothetical protein
MLAIEHRGEVRDHGSFNIGHRRLASKQSASVCRQDNSSAG